MGNNLAEEVSQNVLITIYVHTSSEECFRQL